MKKGLGAAQVIKRLAQENWSKRIAFLLQQLLSLSASIAQKNSGSPSPAEKELLRGAARVSN